jgi:hypothetical protein
VIRKTLAQIRAANEGATMNLKLSELRSARGLLKNAHMLMADVQSLFHNAGDASTASRLKTISHRIADEIADVDTKISAGERDAR